MGNLTLIQNNLIPVYQSKNQEGIVNARELFEFLRGSDASTKFADWIADRLAKYGFEANVDYVSFSQKNEKGGRPSIEYILKMDTAKEIAMVENNEKGRQVRKYFIAVEKEMQNRNIAKVQSKPIRLNLTDSIKALPDSPHKHFKYKQYTDLVYHFVFGKNTKQLREMYGIDSKTTPRDYFTADELERVMKLEHQVSTLIELGMAYNEIKEILNKKFLLSQNA